MPRAIYLIKQTEYVKELETLLDLKRSQYENCLEIIFRDSLNKVDLFKISKNKDESISLFKKQNSILVGEVKNQMQSVRRQKIYKWMAIGACVLTSYGGFRVGIILSK